MEKKLEDETILENVDGAKRDFIKKVVIGTAFAMPVINSFSMEGLRIDLSGRTARGDDDDDDDDDDSGESSGSEGGGGEGGGGGGGGTGVPSS